MDTTADSTVLRAPLSSRRPDLSLPAEGETAAQEPLLAREQAQPRPSRRRWLLCSAAMGVLMIGGGAFLLSPYNTFYPIDVQAISASARHAAESTGLIAPAARLAQAPAPLPTPAPVRPQPARPAEPEAQRHEILSLHPGAAGGAAERSAPQAMDRQATGRDGPSTPGRAGAAMQPRLGPQRQPPPLLEPQAPGAHNVPTAAETRAQEPPRVEQQRPDPSASPAVADRAPVPQPGPAPTMPPGGAPAALASAAAIPAPPADLMAPANPSSPMAAPGAAQAPETPPVSPPTAGEGSPAAAMAGAAGRQAALAGAAPPPVVVIPPAPPRPAPPADPAATAAGLRAAPMVPAQQIEVLGLVTQMGIMMRDQREENRQLRQDVATMREALDSQLADFNRRLSLAEARGAIGAAMGAVAPPPAQPASAAATTPPRRSPEMTAARPEERRRYRVQAASPGLAMLSEVDRSGDSGATLQISVGDEIPGYGRVRSIGQEGSTWIVRAERGSIQ